MASDGADVRDLKAFEEDGDSDHDFAADLDLESEEEEEQIDVSKHASVKEITTLLGSKRLANHIENIGKVAESVDESTAALSAAEYNVILESNRLVAEMDTEMRRVHRFIIDNYAPRFKELEKLVLDGISYAKAVNIIQNATDTTNLNSQLETFLPGQTTMVINITSSNSVGRPLEEDELKRVLEACDEMLQLDETKTFILQYVQSRMRAVAPNLSELVGAQCAAQLVGAAGGLDKLAEMHAGVVQVLGREKKTLGGLSANANVIRAGFLLETDLVKGQHDHKLKKKLVGTLAAKCSLAARVDSNRTKNADETPEQAAAVGRELREQVVKRIEKSKEPPPSKKEKPLPAPDDKPRKKRGGKKARAARAKYQVTEMRKHANRMEFAGDGDEAGEGKNTGMLGKMGSGLLRLRPETKVRSKKARDQHSAFLKTNRGRDSSGISGLASSLVFDAHQGMELGPVGTGKEVKPIDGLSSKYFSESRSFAGASANRDADGFAVPAPKRQKTN